MSPAQSMSLLSDKRIKTMGWTSFEVSRHDKTQDILIREFTQWPTEQNEFSEFKVIDFAMNGSTFYAVMKSQKGSNEPKFFGLICLTKRSTIRGSTEFYYKDMDECAGPYQTKCPKRILDKLDELAPTTNEHALNWRKACRDNLGKPKREYKAGMVLKFGKVEYKLTYKAPSRLGWYANGSDGIHYRMPFSILSRATIEA